MMDDKKTPLETLASTPVGTTPNNAYRHVEPLGRGPDADLARRVYSEIISSDDKTLLRFMEHHTTQVGKRLDEQRLVGQIGSGLRTDVLKALGDLTPQLSRGGPAGDSNSLLLKALQMFGISGPGYTGRGGRHEPVGVVHAGEYVVSSDKVVNNREALDRIQAGAKLDAGFAAGGPVGGPAGGPVGDGGPEADERESFLEGDELAREIYEQMLGSRNPLRAITDFVKERTTEIDALREKNRFMGGLAIGEKERLDAVRTELSTSTVRAIQEMLESGDFPLSMKQVRHLSRLGTIAHAEGSYVFDGTDYDVRYLRAAVRAARGHKTTGELEPDYGDLVTEMHDKLKLHSEELLTAYEEERAQGSGADIRTLEMLSRRLSTTERLRAEIVNLFELNSQQQTSAWNTALGAIGTIFTSLGVSHAISRFGISEPHRFGTVPALQIMGQQGQMGAVMGTAFSELENYNVELNQMMFGAGVGGVMGGAALLRFGAGTLPTRLAGSALALSGTALGAMGVFGQGDDFLRGLGLSVGEDRILGQALARQFSDPTRLLNEFRVSRAGLLGVGVRSPNMGFQTEGVREEESTGNPYLDRMLTRRMGGDISVLRALGYNRESLGALLSQTALSLRDSGPGGLTSLAAHAGEIGELYGIGDEAAIAAMQTAQRFGSRDALGTYRQFAGVFADEEGIDSYSMNVLVPALLKVTESMALRNLARSTEELTGEVVTFSRAVTESDTRLGELARANPEILGRLLTGLQESASIGMQNPAMAALDLSLGATMSDIVLGRQDVALRRFEYIMNQSGIQRFGSADEFLGSNVGFSTLRILQGLFPNIDPQMLVAMTQLHFEGGLRTPEGKAQLEEMAAADEARRIEQLEKSPLVAMSDRMSKQVDEFMTLSSGLIDELKTLQASIAGFLGSPVIAQIMADFINLSAERIEGLRLENRPEARALEAGAVAIPREELGLVHEGTPQGDFWGKLTTELGSIPPSFLDKLDQHPTLRYEIESMSKSGEIDRERLNVLRETYGFSTGGYTGIGGRHEVAGIVHAGEYVISSNNVQNNIEVLNRIQSGETVAEVTQGQGNVTYLTMKIHGMSTEEIEERARRVTEEYIVRNRLNYV